MNEAITWMSSAITTISGYQVAAADSAQAASQSAESANTSKLAAEQAVIDAGEAGAQQVQLAVAAKDSAEAAAAQAAAGLPSIAGKAFMALRVNAAGNGVEWAPGVPNTLVGKTGQSVMLGADKVPYWDYAGQQIGDILSSARNPGALYLPADGSIRLQSAFPLLFAKVGLIGGSIATSWTTVSAIAVAGGSRASRSGTVIASSSGANYGRSKDRGKTFSPVASGLDGSSLTGLNTNNGGVWIGVTNASSPSRLVRSQDDGVTWTPSALEDLGRLCRSDDCAGAGGG